MAIGREERCARVLSMGESLKIALVVGLTLSPLAGLMAFLITYEEYRHHFPARGPALRASVEAGAFAFLVFLVLSLVGGVLASRAAR